MKGVQSRISQLHTNEKYEKELLKHKNKKWILERVESVRFLPKKQQIRCTIFVRNWMTYS